MSDTFDHYLDAIEYAYNSGGSYIGTEQPLDIPHFCTRFADRSLNGLRAERDKLATRLKTMRARYGASTMQIAKVKERIYWLDHYINQFKGIDECVDMFEDLNHEKETITMNYSAAIALAREDVRAVQVKYTPSGQSYTFKSFDETLVEGDLVTVLNDKGVGVAVVEVVGFEDDFEYERPINYKWIIGKVDMEAHDKVVNIEQIAINKMKKAAKIKKRREAAEALMILEKEELAEIGQAFDTINQIESVDEND